MMDWQQRDHATRASSWRRCARPLLRRGLRLHAQGRGARPARRRHAARLRLRRPHRRRPPLRGRQGQRPHRAAHLHAPVGRLRRDPHLEGRRGRPSRDWLKLVTTTKARSKIRASSSAASAGRTPSTGPRRCCRSSSARPACPSQRVVGSPLLARGHPGDGLPKAEEFYISLGLGKTSVQVVVNKILHRLKAGQAVTEDAAGGHRAARAARTRSATASSDLGIEIDGRRRRPGAPGQVLQAGARRPDPGLHLPGARHHDPPRGLPQRAGAAAERPSASPRSPGAGPTAVAFGSRSPSTPGTAPVCWRTSRAPSPSTGSTSSPPSAAMEDQMVHDRFVVEVGDIETLKARASRRCATSTGCSTPTGSRRAPDRRRGPGPPVPGRPSHLIGARRWPGSIS